MKLVFESINWALRTKDSKDVISLWRWDLKGRHYSWQNINGGLFDKGLPRNRIRFQIKECLKFSQSGIIFKETTCTSIF